MTISNDDELRRGLEQASSLLQEIQDYLGRDFSKSAKVRFPRGYIRTATIARKKINFVQPEALKSNISYTMMLTDVQHWLLARTDLAGTAREMVIKLQIFLIGTIIESVTKAYLKGKCGDGYKRRTNYLLAEGLISDELKADLDWLWDVRNKMHLFQVTDSEWLSKDYSVENHNRAMRAFNELLSCLSPH